MTIFSSVRRTPQVAVTHSSSLRRDAQPLVEECHRSQTTPTVFLPGVSTGTGLGPLNIYTIQCTGA